MKVHMAVVLAGNKNGLSMGDEIAKNIMIHFLLIEAFLNKYSTATSAIRSSINNL